MPNLEYYYREAFNWLYGADMEQMSEDEFAMWWRSLSDDKKWTELKKALLCPLFD